MGKGALLNKPCKCGSGKKYKKCCFTKIPGPVPREVIEFFTRKQAEHRALKEAGLHDPIVRPVSFNGKKVWAYGNKLEVRPRLNETPHEFIIEKLKETLGIKWWQEQVKLPVKDRHFIAQCLEKTGDLIERTKLTREKVPGKDVFHTTADGYAKSLLMLAFDVFSLKKQNNLPDSLISRLRTRDGYQGARYEIAIAAIFSRLNCRVEFVDDKSKNKHCEFVATHNETGTILAVEAKSRHRVGVIHQAGNVASEEKLLTAGARRMFNEALEQNPKDVPFATFIDVNSPITPGISLEKKSWVIEIQEMIKRKLRGVNPKEYPLSAAFFTNFSYHYQGEKNAEQGEYIGFIIPDPKFPPPNKAFFSALEGALRHYGFVPNFDEEGKDF